MPDVENSAPRVDATSAQIKRSRWIALLFALLTPVLGMLYCNRGKRAMAYLLATIAILVCVAALVILFGGWRDRAVYFLLAAAVYVYGLFDTWRIASAGTIVPPLRWYARWYSLAVFASMFLAYMVIRPLFMPTFRVGSGAMLPTLQVGDTIIANKLAYNADYAGATQPLSAHNRPAPGDVIVFRFPPDPSLVYVKRVVGTPGDRVTYTKKRLNINGRDATLSPDGIFNYAESPQRLVSAQQFKESWGSRSYDILQLSDMPPILPGGVQNFHARENCSYDDQGFNCLVPQGHYFVMGDNRDSSADSRYWGFVPAANIVGKATFVVGGEGSGFARLVLRIK